MDFELDPALASLRREVRAFVDARVIPAEREVIEEDLAGGRRDTLQRLQAEAKAAGLWTPHLPPEWGGRGLGVMGMCALFREMGRSPVGAKVCNCDAPNQGNMDMLLAVASDAIRDRWLRPLCDGTITSAFAMTEPAPGAGTDPANLRTRAARDGDGWVIDGHKWFASGGGEAAFLIVMARTSDDPRSGATMFVVDRKAPGVTHVRDVPNMGLPLLDLRQAELRLEGVRVRDDAVLGEVGQGFHLAQVRLVPARLTHCMRWLGLATRALEMCRGYLATRTSFGKILARHQLVQEKLADAARDLHAGNLMTLHCAWLLQQGRAREARPYASMAKLHVARTLCRVLDDAIQLHGAYGYSDDLPFAAWYRCARAARIGDGADEVHQIVVARDFLLGRLELLV
jgi:acyl-CoA dehydrogenase